MLILVVGSALYFDPISKGAAINFANNFSTAMMVIVVSSIGIAALMSLSALVHPAAVGDRQEFAIFNLTRTRNADLVAQKLKDMAELMAQMDEEELANALDTVAVFDSRQISKFMTMMAAEVTPVVAEVARQRLS